MELNTNKDPQKVLPVALSIAGSDSGAGAGIQADLLTFAALGVYGTTAITCLTAQNPDGVSAVFASDDVFLRQQMNQVGDYFDLKAIKTGMLYSESLIREVSLFLRSKPEIPCVVDPVMIATSGSRLLLDSAVRCMKEQLFPQATLITPNLDEAAVLLGMESISMSDLNQAALDLCEMTNSAILLKGGHLEGNEIVDVLKEPAKDVVEFRHERIMGVNTHGSGCTLASAIAAGLAKGSSIKESVEAALAYISNGMHHPVSLESDSFISHLGAG